MSYIRFLLALILAALALGPAQVARADDGDSGSGGHDAVVVENTTDGSRLFRFALNVRRSAGEVVDNTNLAVAYARCESCQTVAISIQIVLVSGNPSVIKPQNVAVALNEGCTSCETLASAYQFVVGGGEGRLRFTSEGKRQLADLRRELARLSKQELSLAEIDAAVKAIVDRLRTVLATELVRTTGDDDEDDSDDAADGRDADDGVATTDAATTDDVVTTESTQTETDTTETTETTETTTESTVTETTESTPTETTPTETQP